MRTYAGETVIPATEALTWLQSRRSTRTFSDRVIERPVLERLMQAAISAPSNSNRQPWRYVVITSPEMRQTIVDHVQASATRLGQLCAASPHAAEFGSYSDYFWQPLAAAAAIVIPCVRVLPDTLAGLLRSAGIDPTTMQTPSAMPMEICATSAGVMALMLQAHAEGLGACWMAGPMIAAQQIERSIGGPSAYRMLGAIALGYPDQQALTAPQPMRKPISSIVTFL
jgi:nitroreductase